MLLALQRATHHTLQALSVRLAELQLTASEINVLANLADRPAPNARELGLATGTPPTTLTGVLDRLERRHYITRKLDAADRRSFRVTLTRSGRPVAKRVRDTFREFERTALADVSDQQLAGYQAVIAALQEAP